MSVSGLVLVSVPEQGLFWFAEPIGFRALKPGSLVPVFADEAGHVHLSAGAGRIELGLAFRAIDETAAG